MPVQFVIGRAGFGKTAYCLERIAAAVRERPLGAPVYWILPRQATFIAERELAARGGAGGYFRARILSFEDFGTEVLAECGGTAVPEVTDRGRRMILGHLLRRLGDQLQFFGGVAHQPGVAAELDGTFGELERSGLQPAEIEAQLGTASPSLEAKIHDISLLYSHYTRFLGQDRLDPNRRLAESLAAIGRCRSLREAEVFIDSFYEFTGSERKVIAALGKTCKAVTVTLTCDPKCECIANPNHVPDEMSLFHRTEEAYRRLWFALHEEKVETKPPVLLSEPRRFKSAELTGVERQFVHPAEKTKASKSKDPSVLRIEAPDSQAEVDAVARWIGRLVDSGMRYRDIAVLMRGPEDYHHFLEASFHEHNIPFFVDRRRSASHHPLLRLVRAALGVATTNFSHAAMMAVIKTGLVGLADSDADTLENYVLLHGIDHGTWTMKEPWTGRRTWVDEDEESVPAVDDPQRMDALRRGLVDRLGALAQLADKLRPNPVRVLASAVFRVLEDFACRGQIVKWMEQAAERGNVEEAAEHERVWDELVKLFDELVELFGDEPMSLADFSAILDSALEAFDLALTPPTIDQVLVGTVDRTRTPGVKACAVLGLAEGQFPRAEREDSIFTDADRRSLTRRNIDLEPDTSRRLLDEKFLGYIAMTRGSERLLLTRALCDNDGDGLNASPLWDRVDSDVRQVPREADLPPRLIVTPRQMVGSLMRWVRSGAAEAQWEPIYQWMATRTAGDDAVDVARFRGWKALSYVNEAHLDESRAAQLFPSPLVASAYQLETYRACAYQHFARFGLGLRKREERLVGRTDLSHLFHEVLGRLVGELIQANQSWQSLDEPEAKRRLSRLTAQLGKQLRDELMLSTARNRYLLAHVEKTLGWVASAARAAAGRGNFRPVLVNLRYGPEENIPAVAIATPGGKQALLSGKIDRVDLLADGTACAIDYRLGSHRIDWTQAYHGLCLHLLAYLLVLERNGPHLWKQGSLTPAAAFSVQLLREVEKKDPQEALEPTDERFHLRVKPRGVFDARVAADLDRDLVGGNSEVVQLFIKKDGALGQNSEAALTEQFRSLLRHVERRIGQLADQIMSGRIEIRPYRVGKETPCPRCEFRALCRLEPSPGCYDDLEGVGREEMFERIREEGRT